VGARKGTHVHVSDAKRDTWVDVKNRRNLSARVICDRIKELEPELPRPNEATIRNILTGRTRSTPLVSALDQVLGSREDEVDPEAVDYEAALVRAYHLALESGGDPEAVADAAIDAMARSVEAQLRAKLRALLPGSGKI
jgi:hypothetical protein